MSRSGRRTRGAENHQARTLALQVLFESDLTDHPLDDVLRRYTEDVNLPQPVRRYLDRLAAGTVAYRDEIDGLIADAAPAFPVRDLPAVDRNVLRIAIYELRHEPDVPFKAAINEAVDLAKLFGGENSGRFVNGVLGTVSGKGHGARRRAAMAPDQADQDSSLIDGVGIDGEAAVAPDQDQAS